MFLKNISKTLVLAIASIACINVYGFEDDALLMEGYAPYDFPKKDADGQARKQREFVEVLEKAPNDMKANQEKLIEILRGAPRKVIEDQKSKQVEQKPMGLTENKKDEVKQEVASKGLIQKFSDQPLLAKTGEGVVVAICLFAICIKTGYCGKQNK
jgi:hypothetical protein